MKLTITECAELARDSYAASEGKMPSLVKTSFDKKRAQAVVTKNDILLIPGTNQLSDWFTNFDVFDIIGKKFRAKDAAKSKTGAMFHAGFWEHAMNLHGFAKENKVKFIIGHSLGAATAQILGVALNVPAVGFASPRVKKGKRKLKYENQILNICRADDLVTRVPPSEAGFRRLGKTVRLVPPSVEKGLDHSMNDYLKALSFSPFEGELPKSWGA